MSARHRLDGARLGRVFVERQMRSSSVVVVQICAEPPLKVRLVEYHHVIQQLAMDCWAHALDVRILPGRNARPKSLRRCPFV